MELLQETYLNQSSTQERESIQTITVTASLINEIKEMSCWSLKHIAELAQIPTSTFYKLAEGVIKQPGTPTFRKLLGIFCQLSLSREG